MTPRSLAVLADAVLLLHLGVILFNLFGLVAIPLGAWRGWRFVRIFWWRALHLAILALVALQAFLDRACFLTLWRDALLRQAGETMSGETASGEPLIRGWIEHAIFWPLPLWIFALLYAAVWLYALVLWWLVPPHHR